MTWTSFHRRGEILRDVIAAADQRRDGVLPMDVPGVAETFGDELDLLGALQLRWHTRLAGRIERELMTQPMDLEARSSPPGTRPPTSCPASGPSSTAQRPEPADAAMAEVMAKSADKEQVLLAVMAGRASAHDAARRRRRRGDRGPRPRPPRRRRRASSAPSTARASRWAAEGSPAA